MSITASPVNEPCCYRLSAVGCLCRGVSSPARSRIEVAIGATACAGLVPLAFVVDHEAPVVEGQQAPGRLLPGRRVSIGTQLPTTSCDSWRVGQPLRVTRGGRAARDRSTRAPSAPTTSPTSPAATMPRIGRPGAVSAATAAVPSAMAGVVDAWESPGGWACFPTSPAAVPNPCLLRELAHHSYTASCIQVRVVGLQIRGGPPVAVG